MLIRCVQGFSQVVPEWAMHEKEIDGIQAIDNTTDILEWKKKVMFQESGSHRCTCVIEYR